MFIMNVPRLSRRFGFSFPFARAVTPALISLALVLCSNPAIAQTVPIKTCDATPAPSWCGAVRGDRNSGWLPQSHSEVMARHGVISTMQPLAAMAGMRILQRGGNAIDAAVASAAALNVTFPANVGIGGDLFTIIYIAKKKKIYKLTHRA